MYGYRRFKGLKVQGFKVQRFKRVLLCPPAVAFLLITNFLEHCYKISKLPTKSKILSIQNTK